jgi:glycosyltransferase involved in cell wall biosynthesis
MALLLFCSLDVGGFPFMFADVLNRGGVETYFVCTSRDRSHHDTAAFHNLKTDVPWNLSSQFNGALLPRRILARRLRALVKSHAIDGCFATGLGIGVLEDADIPYKYWSFGNDLAACQWPERPEAVRPARKLLRYAARCVKAVPRVRRARHTFRAAESVMISPYQWAMFRDAIGHNERKDLFWFPHLLATDSLEEIMERKARASERLKRTFDASHIFFSSTRQFWSTTRLEGVDDKGNDVMIRAFANFRRRQQGRAAKLLLVDKGPSVAASRALANEEGVAEHIIFLKEVPRGDLADYYAGADLCFGQFGTPVLSFSTLEPLAYATPTISFVDRSPPPEVPYFPELPPLFISKDPKAIADFMLETCEDKQKSRELETSSWRWVRNYCSERAFVDAIAKTFGWSTPRSAAVDMNEAVC